MSGEELKALLAFMSEGDVKDGKPLFRVVAEKLSEIGGRGITVIKGHFGFGKHKGINEPDPFHNYGNKPVVVLIVDEDEIIDKIAKIIKSLKEDTLVVTWEVEEA